MVLRYFRFVTNATYACFFLDSLDFLFVPECPIPGKMLHYVIRYGVEVVCIDTAKPCGPCSNIDLTPYIWSNLNIIAQIMQ